jgi:glycosyltransferase involved in cell wall biosynthesis
MTIAIISMIRDAWGGSEELWYEMAKQAIKDGHNIIHVAYETPVKHPKVIELEKLGMKQILRPGWVPAVSGLKRTAYLGLNYLRKKINNPISKVLDAKPDIIIYNGTCYSIANEKALLNAIKIKKDIKFFIIGHLNHDTLRTITNEEAQIIKEAYSFAKKVFFVSKRSIETAKRHLCSDIPNALVIRNPVNLFSTDLIPFPPIQDKVKFALVGNLVTAHKGQDILIDALSKWENKNWILNIYGNGMDKTYLENLVNYFQLRDKIFFHGTTNDIQRVWENNHVLLMPSHMEGMPLAVVEAMLCGRVCLATDVGGISEWIINKKNGFIAQSATVNSLLSILRDAWVFHNNWELFGQEAHNTALNLYDPEAGKTLLNYIIAK